jgi:Fe-S cluster biogenesis protein NfuA
MTSKEEVAIAVEEALETIRPYLKADGGDIELVEVTDEMVVKVRLQGACSDCPMSLQTMKSGVEMVVKRAVPDILSVIAID